MNRGLLWRIVAPHFVAGLVVRDGRVVEAAPILGWARGRPWAGVRSYLAGRKWSGTPLRSVLGAEDGDDEVGGAGG